MDVLESWVSVLNQGLNLGGAHRKNLGRIRDILERVRIDDLVLPLLHLAIFHLLHYTLYTMLSLLRNGTFDPIRSLVLENHTSRLFSCGRIHCQTKDAYRQWYKQKGLEDPEWRRRRSEFSSEWVKKKRATDEEYRLKHLQGLRDMQLDELYVERNRQRSKFYGWVTKYRWIREHLPWKSHIPVIYPQRVEHHCTSCEFTRVRGARLWFRSKPPKTHNTEEYLCYKCYTSNGWAASMPQGYEDVRTLKDLVARKKQLDGVDPLDLPK